MENGMTKSDLVRMVGFMGICVGLAWAVQILGLSHDGSVVGRLVWVLAAATVSGAGVGLIFTSSALQDSDGATLVKA